MLTIRNLSKTYPNGVKALNDVCLDVPKGMFGLLGPNGAGKSSLMRTIATLQEADSGSIHLGELDLCAQKDQTRRLLGYLPQEFGVYPRVSALDLLTHFAILKGGQRMLTTQMYVKGHPGNEKDGLYRGINDARAREAVTIDFKPLPDSKLGELTAHFQIVLGTTPEDVKQDQFRGQRRSG